MITVELRGRLGNQMFQYAFAVAAARALGTDFSFFWSSGAPDGEELSRYFTLRGRALPVGDGPGHPVRWVDNQSYDRPEDVLASLTDDTAYGGYFQSERFFAHVSEEVRDAFRVHPDLDASFRSRYAALLETPYVCCPIRRAEYRDFLGGSELPFDYVRAGLAVIRPGPGAPIVFIGDDLDETRHELGDIVGARFEPNEPIVDFQLIVEATAVVIPNSSFAWWGAWLSDARVVAPRYWLGWRHRAGWHKVDVAAGAPRTRRGWEYPVGVIPADWAQVAVRRPWRDRLAPWSIRQDLARFSNNLRAGPT